MKTDDRTRDRRYKDRQREKGFVQVLLWVPKNKAKELSALASRLRKEAIPPSGNTGGINPHPNLPFPSADE